VNIILCALLYAVIGLPFMIYEIRKNEEILDLGGLIPYLLMLLLWPAAIVAAVIDSKIWRIVIWRKK
jgi:hypothetical protein